MKVIGGKIAIEADEPLTYSGGGLYVPPSENHNVLRGTVTAVGGTVTEVKPGDTVHFNKYGSFQVAVSAKRMLHVVDQGSILLVE